MNEQSLRDDPLLKLGFIFGISILICTSTPGYIRLITGVISLISGLLVAVILYIRVKKLLSP